uniref:Uncharacterized protein n=1 Tax=Oryza brachyantha TaxID=4533 RepID=J3KXC7_ORYBR
ELPSPRSTRKSFFPSGVSGGPSKKFSGFTSPWTYPLACIFSSMEMASIPIQATISTDILGNCYSKHPKGLSMLNYHDVKPALLSFVVYPWDTMISTKKILTCRLATRRELHSYSLCWFD